jgi:purine-binding chemotaxis protein CheW
MSDQSFLIFSIQGSLFAIDAHVVQEILWLPELTPIEESPPHIAGVFNLRGKIVPVMDIHIRFGHIHLRYYPADRVIVTEIEGRRTGIIVNEVHDVINIPSTDIEASPLYPKSKIQNLNFVAGEAKLGEQIITLLDIANLIGCTELAPEKAAIQKTEYPHFCPEATRDERVVFRERAKNLIQPAETFDLAGLVALAVVRFGDEYYGVDVHAIREFTDIRNVAPMPCCPEHIIGNMNLRGDILTLVDMRKVLHLPVPGNGTAKKVIAVQAGNLVVGIPVDEVLDIIYLRPGSVTEVPTAVKQVGKEYLKGTVQYDNKMLSVLDVPKILTKDEMVVDEEV